MNGAAYVADGRTVDRERFYALACDPRRSAVVEACAGAGKTWMLVSRIVRALLDGAAPHDVLAITFTRKAAGEMRERLNQWLAEWADPACSDPRRAAALVERGIPMAEALRAAPRLAGLRARLAAAGRPVEIRTFHAWFAQLLRAAPIEALAELGLPTDMELVENTGPHRAAVFRRFHAALLADAGLRTDHDALIAARGRSQVGAWLGVAFARHVEIELADRAGVLETSVPLPGVARPGEHPARVLAGAVWQAGLTALAEALGASDKVRAREAATGLRLALEEADAAARFRRVWFALFTKENTRRKQLPEGLEALTRIHAELEALHADVRQYEAHVEHGRMVRLARRLLAEYRAYKQARGLVDMPDLERCALALLGEATLAGWIQERLDLRIRHLLIDEFQDTSPLQWHALQAWLGGYGGAGGGASGQRPLGVFIVGDPKQSIYRFRRAEPRVFAAARDFVVDALGGHSLACDHTRRNAPEVLAAMNAVFGRVAAAGEFDGFRPHTTECPSTHGAGDGTPPEPEPEPAVARLPATPLAEPAPKAATAGTRPWRDTLLTPRHAPEARRQEQEPARVAGAIRTLLRSGRTTAGEIFVLARRRGALRRVAAALRDVDVGSSAVENSALTALPEARDLIALLDALVSPRHRLSLAQALRSPLFGARDDDLLTLAAGAEHGDWWDALLRGRWDGGGSTPASVALQRAQHLLPRWRSAAAALPPHDLLDRIVFEGELRERVAAAVPPVRRAEALFAIDAVIGQALTLDGARYATPYGFVRALKRGDIEASPPSEVDAVQLLTVHGAKGLEADVVFVVDADPERRNADTATLLVDWPVDATAPRRCAFVYAESNCPPSLATLLDHENAARRREELNALYVAMSRARRRLVFSATTPLKPDDGASWWGRIQDDAVAIDGVEAAGPTSSVAEPSHAGTPASVPPATLLALAFPARPASRGVPAAALPAPSVDSARRLGQAVHRVLEWAGGASFGSAGAAGRVTAPWTTLADAAAAEFDAPPAAVARLAGTILGSPACARFFASDLGWAGNEVPIGEGGEPLRIDRLVRIDHGPDGPEWWVLDYKLQQSPAELEAHREQLLRYRRAVRQAEPGARVRCAFVTGAGTVIEVD